MRTYVYLLKTMHQFECKMYGSDTEILHVCEVSLSMPVAIAMASLRNIRGCGQRLQPDHVIVQLFETSVSHTPHMTSVVFNRNVTGIPNMGMVLSCYKKQ